MTVDIVFIAGDGLAVLFQRAVHHDGGEAVGDRRNAGRRLVAVIEMQTNGNVRIFFRRTKDEMAQERIARIGASTAACLQDDGGIGGVSSRA